MDNANTDSTTKSAAVAAALKNAQQPTLLKSETVKSFKSLHTWTGVGAGMALFIAFFAGAITVFHHELYEWDSYTDIAPKEQNIAQAQVLLESALEEEPGAAESLRLYLAGHEGPQNVAYWYERGDDGTFEAHRFRLTDEQRLDTSLDTAHVADFIYRLHYTAGFMPARLGLYALGIICILYGMALFSGVLLFIPNFLKDLMVVRSGGKNVKRFWLDAHNVIGVISLPMHILFAWSSAILAIGVFFLAPFQYLVFDGDLIETVGPELGVVETPEPTGQAASMLSISELISIAEQEVPGFETEQLRFTHFGDENASVALFGPAAKGTLLSGAGVTINAASGEVISRFDPREASAGATFYRGLTTLHFVDFGGYFVKWTFFLLSMLGAFLFYSGNLLFVESRRKRRQEQQPGKAVTMAKLNTGVCIGSIAGIAMALLATRFFAALDNRSDVTEVAYYAVFFLSLAWAIYRPVALGTRDLLNVAALLCCAIPVIDATLIEMPLWRSFVHGHWSIFMVDLIALMFAGLFLRLARAVSKRAQDGPTNSVWSYREEQEDANGLELGEMPGSVVAAVAKQ
ncbi:MAG: PepSY-associated TM helix domain-containing protein [Pseudomonadota bacterium]